MACAHPWPRAYDYGYGYKGVNYIPCGYCLNCRKDKQQYYIDRAEYEYKTRLTASFVTFTYDEIHNMKNIVLNPQGGFEYDISSSGDKVPRFSLDYKDLTDFIQNIRKRIEYFYETHPDVKESLLMQKDFSYLYCGEYGDCFNRNHFHVLFFGLDFAFCEKLFYETWKNGFIDVLPLLDGGIRYVVKYMDKQTFGELASLQYDMKGLARPKIRMSVGFGKGLLTDNATFIKENGMCYPARHNTLRPISAYWKKLLTGNNHYLDTSKSIQSISNRLFNLKTQMSQYNLKDFSIKAMSEFKINQARKREYNLAIMIRNAGYPVEEFENIRFNKFFTPSIHREKLKKLPIDIQRLLAEEYRESLYEDSIPF